MVWIARSMKAFDGDDGPHFDLDRPEWTRGLMAIIDPHDEAV
jgi:hypothetical protein